MRSYQLEYLQNIPVSTAEAWDFFSSPLNLAKITPEDMAFTVTSKPSMISKMYPGMLITYKVSPLLGIKLDWMTEITHVAEGKYFVDEQRFGPYKFWHHQHHFREIQGGTEMKDIVTYGLPLGPIGTLANNLLVAGKLRNVFEYRKRKITELFGTL